MIAKESDSKLIRTLLFSVALLSIGAISQNNIVMAKSHPHNHKILRHHKARYKIVKRYKQKKYIKRNKDIKPRIKKVKHIKLKSYPGDFRYNGHLYNKAHFYHVLHVRLLNDINNSRKKYGLPPLKDTSIAQKIANYRSSKVAYAYNHYNDYKKYKSKTSNPSDGWVHGYFNNTSILSYLHQHKLNYEWDGENAQAFGSYYNTYGDGKPFLKPNTCAINVADDTDDNLMNHDLAQGNQNGHRINELDPHYKAVGIGIAYNRRTHIGGITEDFLS